MSDFEVVIDPVGQPIAYEKIKALLADDLSDDPPKIRLKVTPPRSEKVFEKGDSVTVEFDHGRGMAMVEGVGIDADGRRYVQVKYGPRGKHRTNLSPDSVETNRRHQWPATVEVLDEPEVSDG